MRYMPVAAIACCTLLVGCGSADYDDGFLDGVGFARKEARFYETLERLRSDQARPFTFYNYTGQPIGLQLENSECPKIVLPPWACWTPDSLWGDGVSISIVADSLAQEPAGKYVTEHFNLKDEDGE